MNTLHRYGPFAASIALCVSLWAWAGCAPLQPGADPFVVRVEQAETTAQSTFDLVLNLDYANAGWWKTNAPAFHAFCNWLRTPQTVDLTNTLPRCSAMILSLDDVKLSYQASKANSNDVYSALMTLESAVNQAASWATVITNAPTQP